MNPEQMKAIVRRWLVGIWDEMNFQLMDELASSQYSYEMVGEPGAIGGQHFRDLVMSMHTACPDLNNTIDEQIAEGDVVITKGTTRGTQKGILAGIPPTGKSIAVPWVVITKFQDGRIISDWELYDALGMMTQLGAVSMAAQA
jgi:steroid delta-isomerase-like uncharacterized protein